MQGGSTHQTSTTTRGGTSGRGGASASGGTTAPSSTGPVVAAGGAAPCENGFTLLAQTPQPQSDRPYYVRLDDFDRDGLLDMAATAQPNSTVRTYRGDGHAHFSALEQFIVPDFAAIVDSADLDGDGLAELFVSTHESTQLSVLWNLGGGRFVPAVEYTLERSPYAIVHGDLNRDGRMDIVVGHDTTSGTYEVGLGTGTGTFEFQSKGGLGVRVCGLTLADLDGDEILDLVAANLYSANLSVLLGNGTGSFDEMLPVYQIANGGPVDLKAADFDRDGRVDLAVADWQRDAVFVLRGDGKGGFSSSTTYAVGADPRSVVIDDFDGNGTFDIATGAFGSPMLTLLLGRGDGTFVTRTFDVASGVYFIASGDVNSDGRPDLVLVEPNANQIQIMLNTCS
jgi:hypothetical protein